jgi:NADH-quinone oxidoreductase subunit J
MIIQVLFYLFAAVAVVSASLAVTRKNAVAAALWLVLMFFGLAGVFVLLEAYFVAVVQVLVYAGAIMVLFLFVIMLLDLRSDELDIMGSPDFRRLGLALAGAFLAITVVVLWRSRELLVPAAGGGPDGAAAAIGSELFNRWLLAFEVTSFLLLGAILGAVVLTKRRLT